MVNEMCYRQRNA